MIEKPSSYQVIETSSDTPRPSTVEGAYHLERSHQVSQSNSAKNPTKVDLDAALLASTGVEEHNVPSQSSRLIPEYVNFRISGLR